MKKSRMFWGVLFIAVAILLVISQLGIWNIQISVLTLVLTVFFGVSTIWSLFHKKITEFLFSLAFLAILYDKPLGIEAITPWTVLLAALLASIGCQILFQPKKKKKYYHKDVETLNDDNIYVGTNFGSSIKYIDTQNFKQAYIKNIAGTMKVYFDHAFIQELEATIELNVSCAMLEIYIPRTWQVIDKTDNILSSVEIEMISNDMISHKIILIGKVNLSEVKIKYI